MLIGGGRALVLVVEPMSFNQKYDSLPGLATGTTNQYWSTDVPSCHLGEVDIYGRGSVVNGEARNL